jgi:hypothetical protein
LHLRPVGARQPGIYRVAVSPRGTLPVPTCSHPSRKAEIRWFIEIWLAGAVSWSAPERIRTSDLRFRRLRAKAFDLALASRMRGAGSPESRHKDAIPERTRLRASCRRRGRTVSFGFRSARTRMLLDAPGRRRAHVQPFRRGRHSALALPADELPDLGQPRAFVAADVREQHDRALEVRQRVVGPPGGVMQVGQVVLERGLAMAVALGGADP